MNRVNIIQCIKVVVAVMIALLAIWNWPYLLTVADTVAFTNHIILIPILIALIRVMQTSFNEDLKYYKYAMPVGLFYGFALICGIQLIRYQKITFRDFNIWEASIVYGIVAGALVGRAFSFLDKHNAKTETKQSVLDQFVEWRFFRGLCIVVMLGGWLPVWLASYPGFFCVDVGLQYEAFITDTVTKFHPVMHTTLLGIVISTIAKLTGSVNLGIAVLTWIQMIFLALVFSYVLKYLKALRISSSVILTGLAVFAFLPTIQIYIGCTTKDLMYSGFFMLLVVKVIQWFKEPESYWKPWRRKIGFGFVMFMAMAFRNNAMYIMIVFMGLGLFLIKVRKRLFYSIAGVSIAVFLLYNGPFLASMGIEDGMSCEMYSIPIQQLGRTYIQAKTLTEKDKELMFSVIPKGCWDCYHPKTSDPIKSGFSQETFDEVKGELLSLWIKQGIKNPAIYVNAFLMNTVDSWCPNSVLDGHVGYFYDREFIQSCYFTPQVDQPGVLASKWPELYNKIVDIGYKISFQKVPVVSMLFSVGAMLWFFIFSWAYALYKKQYHYVMGYTLIVISYFTHLFGPMVLVRYNLMLFFSIPISLAILFGQCSEKEKELL